MTAPLSLGISPCPNDTFIFDALVHGRVPAPAPVEVRFEDVETLNQLAREGALDVTKISYHAYFHVADRYRLLDAGGALGFGCGPLLVTRDPGLRLDDLAGRRVATPGRWTTAALLLGMAATPDLVPVEMPFDDVLGALDAGEVEAGLIIHELRFTYQALGYRKLVDLGEWWEAETGCPIPLGGILVRRDADPALVADLDAALCASVEHAWQNPDDALPWMAAHAQDMDPEVMRAHVGLYVNEFSRGLGEVGRGAVEALYRRGRAAGLLPEVEVELLPATAPTQRAGRPPAPGRDPSP